jgi:hypothetical protein
MTVNIVVFYVLQILGVAAGPGTLACLTAHTASATGLHCRSGGSNILLRPAC